uniref:Uncharacterized protein n=1 Tax=Oryza brachyantha TaxID=4533 RepID=J3KZG6_ORYBR
MHAISNQRTQTATKVETLPQRLRIRAIMGAMETSTPTRTSAFTASHKQAVAVLLPSLEICEQHCCLAELIGLLPNPRVTHAPRSAEISGHLGSEDGAGAGVGDDVGGGAGANIGGSVVLGVGAARHGLVNCWPLTDVNAQRIMEMNKVELFA